MIIDKEGNYLSIINYLLSIIYYQLWVKLSYSPHHPEVEKQH